MNEFKKRQRIKKIIYSRAIVILLVIVALFVARGVWDIFWKYKGSVSDEQELKAELASLTSQETYLASSTAELQSPSGLTYELQEKFGAVLPGEKEIVLVNTATSGAAQSAAPGGFFFRIWNWITNL